LADLSLTTGLPKPTLVRLLDTLITAGYVRRLPRRGGYRLTERVMRLSGGFRHADNTVEVARPFLSALTAEHKWPVAIATLDSDAMLIRASTVQESPFATDPDIVDQRVPMLLSAVGRAYLAYCPSEEREAILNLLRASPRVSDAGARDARQVQGLLQYVRRKGYASAGFMPNIATKAVAVPIIANDRVLAAITLRYLALTEEQAARRFLPSLRQAAERIVSAIGAK